MLLQEKVMVVKNKHVEDMQAQMTAHKLAVDMIRKEAENLRQEAIQGEQKRSQQLQVC